MRCISSPVAFALGALAVGIFSPRFTDAQTIVNSTFSQPLGSYSDPANWTPPEVPNNSATRQYNVTLAPTYGVTVDIDATISNLILDASQYGGLSVDSRTFTVVGTTLQLGSVISVSSSGDRAGSFDAGNLSTFSDGVLAGAHSLLAYGSNSATLRFRHANVTTLASGSLTLQGQLTRVVDENDNDGLASLSKIGGDARLTLDGRDITLQTLTNDGELQIAPYQTATTATAMSLGNYDAATQTVRGGRFTIGSPGELRFGGGDIVNNASSLKLNGANSRLSNLNGADALRPFARNLAEGSIALEFRDFTTAGDFTNDGSISLEESVFSVTGALTNYDAATRTLTGGSYTLLGSAKFRFVGADIVHNGASITWWGEGRIVDEAGQDALRNFSDNLSSGVFRLEDNSNWGSASNFTSSGDFTNAGTVDIPHTSIIPEDFPAVFTVPHGFTYRQTAGVTSLDGTLVADNVIIDGGVVTGPGTIKGNVSVGKGTFAPSGMQVSGDLSFSDDGTYSGASVLIEGSTHLAGTLVIDFGGFPGSTDTRTILTSSGPLTGTFTNVANGGRLATKNGGGSYIVSYDSNHVVLSNFQASPLPAQMLNISTRSFVYAGDRVMICGFMINGDAPKRVLLRGIGPSQGPAGIWVDNPRIDLYDGSGEAITGNDDWKDTQRDEIEQSGLAPRDDREAAIVATLAPGSYTVVLQSVQGFGGTAVVEAYDLSAAAASRMVNLSTRGALSADNPLIGGVIAGGEGPGNADLVVRVLGPSLTAHGISDVLENPAVELRDADGALVDSNDDWGSNSDKFYSSSAVAKLVPGDPRESMLQLSLPHGSYTAVVKSDAEASVVALIEIYDLRR